MDSTDTIFPIPKASTLSSNGQSVRNSSPTKPSPKTSERLSERTRAALQAAKAHGKVLGNPDGGAALANYIREHGNDAALAGKSRAADARAESWRGTLQPMVASNMSLNAIANALNAKGEVTVRGGRWTATAVRRLVARLGLDSATAQAA